MILIYALFKMELIKSPTTASTNSLNRNYTRYSLEFKAKCIGFINEHKNISECSRVFEVERNFKNLVELGCQQRLQHRRRVPSYPFLFLFREKQKSQTLFHQTMSCWFIKQLLLLMTMCLLNT